MELKSGMFIKHKFRKEEKIARISYISDDKIYLDNMSGSFWLKDNVTPSTKFIHVLINFFKGL